MTIRAIFAVLGIAVAGVIVATVAPKNAFPSVGWSALPPPYATSWVYNWPLAIPQPDGAKSLAFVPFSNGKPRRIPDFLSGWMMSPEKPEIWGRPVDLLEPPGGRLLVSDDGGKKLWHIRYEARNK